MLLDFFFIPLLLPLATADSNINLISTALSSCDPGVISWTEEWSTVLPLGVSSLAGAPNALWLPMLRAGRVR